MPSNRTSTPTGADRGSRRAVLAAVGAGIATSVAGCTGVLPGSPRESDIDPAEVVAVNETASDVEIAVRILDRTDETLFSHVFGVGPEKTRSRGAIETVADRIHAFTPGGVSRRWEYDPDLPADFDCEIKDVGLTLEDSTLEPWYSC